VAGSRDSLVDEGPVGPHPPHLLLPPVRPVGVSQVVDEPGRGGVDGPKLLEPPLDRRGDVAAVLYPVAVVLT
jgi:hypothetical protein